MILLHYIVFSLLLIDVVEMCPDMCLCTSMLKTLTCTGDKLTRVPKNIPSYATVIALYSNNITRIEPTDFTGLPDLKMLMMKDTNLKAIFEALESLRSLTVLSLEDSLLDNLPIFPTGMQLRTLDVSGNMLKVIENKTFANLEHLDYLTLSNNQISNIQENAFVNLNGLTKLHLNNNFLRSIPDNLFVDLWKLELLNLADNNLIYLQNMVFKGLKELKQLELKNNHLVEMEKNSLSFLENIKIINLIQNKLTSLHPDILQPKVRFLYLYGNLIPCTCAYFRLLRRASQPKIYADCLLYNNASERIEHWLQYNTKDSASLGIRHCRECSKQRSSFCSFNATGSNFTCVFIQDARNVWTRNPLLSTCTNINDIQVRFPVAGICAIVIAIIIGISLSFIFCKVCDRKDVNNQENNVGINNHGETPNELPVDEAAITGDALNEIFIDEVAITGEAPNELPIDETAITVEAPNELIINEAEITLDSHGHTGSKVL